MPRNSKLERTKPKCTPGQVWEEEYDYQISNPKAQGFVQPTLQVQRVTGGYAHGIRYPSHRTTKVKLAADGSLANYRYLGEMRPAPEWRKSLSEGTRVIVEREDDGASVLGGRISITKGEAWLLADFPKALVGKGALRPDWFAFERYWLRDPKTGECAWMKLTCAL